MNAKRWMIHIIAVAAAAGVTATAIANESEPTLTGNRASTDVNSNSAAQLGPAESAIPRRSGDSTPQLGSDNPAAQMGSGLNANPGAQLNNEPQATSAPPVDSDSNAPEHPATTDTSNSHK